MDKFIVGDLVKVVTDRYAEPDAKRYLGRILVVLNTQPDLINPPAEDGTQERGYISEYRLRGQERSSVNGGIWFSSLELVQRASSKRNKEK